jgi:ATP-dependent DNA helicase RecG
MTPLRIFISSVQKELAEERLALRDYLNGDTRLRKFFEAFLFEEVPAADKRTDATYLDEVARCDIYLGIFGKEYGWEDDNGLSPTHHEFREATRLGKTRQIYVKGADNSDRHPKMSALIDEAGASLIRRRFNAAEELVSAVYASLIRILEEREIIRSTPFDASWCRNATLEDLDYDKITRFLTSARYVRSFPLAEGTPPVDVLLIPSGYFFFPFKLITKNFSPDIPRNRMVITFREYRAVLFQK